MEDLKFLIAGEITMSSSPGSVMRKWREIFNISQNDLATYLGISPSTLSDYESGRRKSPGVGVVRRYVNALFEIDMARGGQVIERLKVHKEKDKDYYTVINFYKEVEAKKFVELIEGEVITNKEVLENIKLHGVTIIDSIRAILEMNWESFPYLYGGIGERAFIFLEVSTGRSPLVVIKVAPIKPRIVVLHGISKVDSLAIKISEREKIPIVITKKDVNKIKESLFNI